MSGLVDNLSGIALTLACSWILPALPVQNGCCRGSDGSLSTLDLLLAFVRAQSPVGPCGTATTRQLCVQEDKHLAPVGQEVGAAVATELRCGLMLCRWHRRFLEAADAFQLDLVGDSGCYGDHDRGPSELNDNSWKTKGRNNFADVQNKLLLTFTSKRV